MVATEELEVNKSEWKREIIKFMLPNTRILEEGFVVVSR